MIRSATVLDRLRFIRTLVFFLASCSGIRSGAQVSTATVAGVVQDSTKASIPGASVKLINTQTGTENGTTTSHDGSFVLPGVLPGAYTLQFERQGYFVRDRDSTPDRPVFNRTIGLRDTFAKEVGGKG